MNDATALRTEKSQPDLLTETLQSKLSNPEQHSEFDLHDAVNQVLNDVGLSTADTGGKLTFYGSDPILQSPIKFGTMAAVGLEQEVWRWPRFGDKPPVKDKTSRWTCERRCGASPGSLRRNGKP